MSLDNNQTNDIVGAQPALLPMLLVGLFVAPASVIPSSQLTGDGSTVLRLGHSGGRARLFDRVMDYAPGELAVITTSGAQYDDGVPFAANAAVWGTLVAVQHRVNAAITLRVVIGAVASTRAGAVKPTFADIEAALDDPFAYCILGDVLWERSADTVITTVTTDERRPEFVDTARKTSFESDNDDPTVGVGGRFWGYIDICVDLALAFGLGAGALYADGANLPPFEYGGYIRAVEYIPAVGGAGAGADITLRPGVSGTPATTCDLQLLLATTALAQHPEAVASTVIPFKAGDNLDVEVEAAATAFTAGSGILRYEVWEYAKR